MGNLYHANAKTTVAVKALDHDDKQNQKKTLIKNVNYKNITNIFFALILLFFNFQNLKASG